MPVSENGWTGEFEPGSVRPRCYMPWQQMVIGADGEVVPCCYYGAYGSAHPPCGNVNRQSILDIWNGEGYR